MFNFIKFFLEPKIHASAIKKKIFNVFFKASLKSGCDK